jgi:hypothetical protein
MLQPILPPSNSNVYRRESSYESFQPSSTAYPLQFFQSFTMNRSPASFPAASPCTFLFVEENSRGRRQAGLSPSSTGHKSSYFHPRAFGVREASRQRWESLKPLIQRVYIEEDRPYHYLAHLLKTQHGFATTYDFQVLLYSRAGLAANEYNRKRQFSRKIIEWEFRKNVSSFERREILQTLPEDTSYSALDSKDLRLKPEKIRNWRKRYRDDVDEQTCQRLQPQSSASLGQFILSPTQPTLY